MHTLLKNQLQKIYGKDFNQEIEDEKFQSFIKLVQESYKDYEEQERFLKYTLQKSAKELQRSKNDFYKKQELLKSVENSMEDAIFYKDLEHRYIGGNTKFLEFLSLTEEELIGKNDFDFFDAPTANRYREMNDDIMKNKTKTLYKQWVSFQDKKFFVLISKTALVNKRGEVIGIVGISRDITHEYELQQEVEYKNIMLVQQAKHVSMGEMIANIAHQWRQPLNALSLLIQKLGIFYKQDLLNDEKIDAYISDAKQLMYGMSETIDDFRNFFSSQRVIENFNIEESILKSEAIIKLILEKNHIELHLNMQNEYFANGYKNEFFQVMLNILNNAVEALIEDKIAMPRINIDVRDQEDYIIIDICDNAHGIKNLFISKIFDPYFTTKEKGTGLGLYMSKIIIQEHMKGKLSVKSTHMGTSFKIRLNKGG